MIDTPQAETLDNILRNLKKSIHIFQGARELSRNFDLENCFKHLKATTENIGTQIARRPVTATREYYIRQWEDFLAKKRTWLEKRALRYLCWEPDIALHKAFILLIDRQGSRLSASTIQALVRSCHMRWDNDFAKGHVVSKIVGYTRSYNGPNKIVSKWKNNIDMVLGPKAVDLFAQESIKQPKPIDQLLSEWAFEAQTSFIQQSMKKTATLCRDRLGDKKYNDHLLNEVLQWDKWELATFKEEIGKSILHNHIMAILEQFQRFILRDKRLGDPRLRRNTNWLGIADEAKKTFISWLSRRDIVFFFDHVLPDSQDRHRRKDFWLKYVGKLIQSRPLLCEYDKYRLREQSKDVNFGLIAGSNSSFMLDFGSVVCVEFSNIGACYVYPKYNFDKVVSDFYADAWFTETELKRKELLELPGHRIIHRITVNTDWRDDLRQLLARKGIRPE